jgi:tripartite-type tricarboxylate transporter receptor subunit TctC
MRDRRADTEVKVGQEGMRHSMRKVILSLVSVLTGLMLNAAPPAAALDYPIRPVRLIVGFAAGGPTDILARLMGQWLSQRLAQQFIVENRAGAGSNTATDLVAKAPADGYTVLVITTSNAINTKFYRNLPFNFMQDIVPVAGLGRITYVMAVSPSLPVKSVAELIAHCRANPGQVNFASAGVGGSNHIAGEMFKALAGIDIVHVPYRGNAAAYPDLISGRTQFIFADLASALALVRAGSLKGLAITAPKRLAALPDLPPVADTVPGYQATAWYGFGVPKGTPSDVVEMLNREINAGLEDTAIKQRFREMETEPLVFDPVAFQAFMQAEAKRWGDAVEAAGVKAD